VEVEVGCASSIAYSVEHAPLIEQDAAPDFAVCHHAKVAVGNQVRRKSPLDKRHVGVRLQKLESDRGFVLAPLDLKLLQIIDVHECVLNDDRATAEVRHKFEIKVLGNGSFED